MQTTTKIFCLCLLILCGEHLFAQASCWHQDGVWTGTGTFQTDILEFRGERWRLRYRSKTGASLRVSMHTPDGTFIANLISQSGLNNSQGGRSGSIDLPRMKKVYLMISGSEAWQVSLEQYVTEVDCWELMQLAKRSPALDKFGVWSGEAGMERVIELDVPSDHWRCTVKAFGQGRLRVEVFNEEGKLRYRSVQLDAGSVYSWFHRKGHYTLKVSPMDTDWSFLVEVN
ncbi:MAG: hypothetical protein IJJ33_08280 [Victivallales bacterium]|nr:hypothetical protein [Victivallales bacterium]